MNETVVDAHVHLLPGRLAEKVRAYFGPVANSIVYPLDHGIVRQRLAEEGIDEIWTLPYAHKPGVAEWLNEATRDIAAAPGPLVVVPGATVHPGDDDPTNVVRRAVEDFGARMLKLHCSVGAFDADDERLHPVWDYVASIRLPVVVHVGHATNGMTDAHELAPIDVVARAHPDAVVIIAHCGHPAVQAALDVVETHPDVYADLTPVVHHAPVIPPDRVASVGDKLLFGSDAPNTTTLAGEHLRAVRLLADSEAHRHSMTGGLARHLIGRTTR